MQRDFGVDEFEKLLHAYAVHEPVNLDYRHESPFTYYVITIEVLFDTSHSGGRRDRMVQLSLIPADPAIFTSPFQVDKMWHVNG